MQLINCKIKLNLTWKKECALSNQVGAAVFIINDTKMYVPVVTLSKEDKRPHELLLTTRQNTKLRNAINNNLTTDIKLSKAQIKNLIQSGGFLGKLLSKLLGPLM